MEEKIKYRYFATGRSGTRQVHPVNGQSYALEYTKSDEKLDYDLKISDKLKFVGDDFFWLFALEKTIYRCDYLIITIEKYCNGEWDLFFKGRVSLNSGDPWNIDIGFVELSVLESANYDCIDDFGDTDYNLFAYLNHNVTVSTISGTIENQSFNVSSGPQGEPPDQFPGEENPYAKGWAQSYIKYHYESSGGSAIEYTINVTWTREVKTVPLDVIYDSPWVEISSDATNHVYARSPILFNPVYGAYDPSNPNDSEVSYSILSKVIDNGMNLKDVFTALLQVICPQLTLESDFFQWNPTTISNINYVTDEISKVRNLVLFQKTDVKRPSATNNASSATTNFNDLLKDICNIFQLQYAVTDDGKFKIESEAYYADKPIGIDTTSPLYLHLTRGNRAYSYDQDKIPNKETFKFMDISYGDFASNDIVYSGSCAGQGDAKDIAYNVDHITTDVQLCLNNPASDSAVSEDGFVLIACDEANAIMREPLITGGNVLNNTLAWAQLHRDYWRYNRAQKTFMMNGLLTTAITVKPTKLQIDFKIPFCCEVFDPKLFVKSSLSASGVIKSAKYDMYRETMTLSILHPADEGLIDNEAPITIGDTASTFKNVPVTIDVIANDYDPDGTINPDTLTIVGPPTHGTAVVTPDNKILYTPSADYFGMDFVLYNVKDNLGEISANTLVNITVIDGTPTIQAHDDTYTIARNVTLKVPAPGLLSNDTGPSVLTAVAETVSTVAGGSAVISNDGSFTYTPPAGYTGPDSFQYTARDINLNTSMATATVNVFVPSNVYVRLRRTGPNFPSSIVETCNGQQSMVGEQQRNDFFLDFFSDSGHTTPLDVTNYGLIVGVHYDQVYDTGPSPYDRFISVSGEVYQIEDEIETYYSYQGCNNNLNQNRTLSLSLLPGTGYNI